MSTTHVYHTPKGKMYACFVDLKKAYDSVWHDGLFAKLASINVSGSFLNILVNLYQKSSNAVKINGFRTNFFCCGRGVRQGCPLSPNLFNIYVNELPQLLNKVNDSPILFQMEQKQVASCMLMISLFSQGLPLVFKNVWTVYPLIAKNGNYQLT